MKTIRRHVLALCALFVLFSMTACQSAQVPSTVDKATAVQDTTHTEYPVTITDSMKRSITLTARPQKVVSVAPNITELLFALGLGDSVIGRTDYCDYPEEVKNIASIGTLQEPDIEKIISLEPDVVIASTHFSEESEQKLTELGVPVVILYEEHDISGVYTMIETLGTLFDIQQKASDMVSEMKTTVGDTTKAIEGLDAPSVYYVVGFGEYGDYTAGGDTFIGELLTLAGGDNIAKEVSGWSYSLESLVEADPDIILIDNSMKDSFLADDAYKGLSAVKNGTVYGIDKNTIERQGYRNAEGVAALAKLFHPDAFK